VSLTFLILVLLGLSLFGFLSGRRRALAGANGRIRDLHSLPGHYGYYVALWGGLPSLLLILAWLVFEPQVIEFLVIDGLPEELKALPADQFGLLLTDLRNLASGNVVSREADDALLAAAAKITHYRQVGGGAMAVLALAVAIAGMAYARRRVAPKFRARNAIERTLGVLLVLSSTIAILITVGIVLSLAFESFRFFAQVPFDEFLFGLKWSPQTAIRDDQVGASGSFGAIPLFTGTLLITVMAMLVAVPIGLMSAIYLSDFARPKVRAVVKPVLEILAGVPTVVYGFFAAITVAPFVRQTGEALGLSVASESAFAAGLVMGVMIIPFVSSLSDDVINAVPQTMRDGSYALGATESETIIRVVLPAALPGVIAAILLAVSRAIGETMIVVMAAGLAANLTANPFEAVTTVTVQIVTLLVGDQEFDSAKTLAAFALGLVLFVITLMLNMIALKVVRRYREIYE
jgi:phosphate transport system permease protein